MPRRNAGVSTALVSKPVLGYETTPESGAGAPAVFWLETPAAHRCSLWIMGCALGVAFLLASAQLARFGF